MFPLLISFQPHTSSREQRGWPTHFLSRVREQDQRTLCHTSVLVSTLHISTSPKSIIWKEVHCSDCTSNSIDSFPRMQFSDSTH